MCSGPTYALTTVQSLVSTKRYRTTGTVRDELFVLQLDEPAATEGIARAMLGEVAPLCVQKFSSNVIEKALELADERTRRALITEIADPERLPRLLLDGFGNYVVQRALAVAPPDLYAVLVEHVRPHLALLRPPML